MRLTRDEKWEPFLLPDLRVKPEKNADSVEQRGEHLIITERNANKLKVTLLCYHLPILGRLSPRSVSKTGPVRRPEELIKDVDHSRRFLENELD